MEHAHFTMEEIELLRSNPNTYSVTPGKISFTESFHNQFWDEYSKGKSPTRIFLDAGYDVNILGPRRIEHFTAKVKRSLGSNTGYYNGLRSETTAPSTGDKVTDDRLSDVDNQLRILTHQVAVLEQEMDFLKKNYSAVSSARH